jgi:C4-dicarboxylate-specific signal transduction histidine kinase
MQGPSDTSRLGAEVRARRALEEEMCALEHAGDLAEVLGAVMHEVNNQLNAFLWQAAVLEMKVPEDARAELADLRKQGGVLGSLLGQLQRYRRGHVTAGGPADLNEAVRRAATSVASGQQEGGWPLTLRVIDAAGGPQPGGKDESAIPVRLALAPDLPRAKGGREELRRLAAFLLKSATAAAAQVVGGEVLVRTEARPGRVALIVEDTGPAVAEDLLAKVFEPHVSCRPGPNSLEMAACESIAKRLRGDVQAEGRAQGLVVTVDLPAESP